jgi:hypothetical protein
VSRTISLSLFPLARKSVARVNPTILKRMTNFTNYVYSKAAASRIFEKKAESVLVERDRAIITFTDGTSETANTSRFKEHFASYRQQEGEKVNPMIDPKDETLWYVSKYRVTVYSDHLTCTCQDRKSQSAIADQLDSLPKKTENGSYIVR